MTIEATEPAIIAAKQARALDDRALAVLFTEARTANKFLPEPVPEALLRRLVELTTLGPTSANSSPMRIVFVVSPEAKERLRPALSAGNLEKTMAAPVTAIVAQDLHFHHHLPVLFPHRDMKSIFEGNAALRETNAFRNASLQGAYLILAARALGLDAGPMSGFDNGAVDKEFFPDGRLASNFLINLGYADDTATMQRLPRLPFEQVATIV